jgi:hypothetical protein
MGRTPSHSDEEPEDDDESVTSRTNPTTTMTTMTTPRVSCPFRNGRHRRMAMSHGQSERESDDDDDRRSLMSKTKRVAIYVRVSTGEQTTANQLKELKAWAKHAGHDVVKIYEDAASAAPRAATSAPPSTPS